MIVIKYHILRKKLKAILKERKIAIIHMALRAELTPSRFGNFLLGNVKLHDHEVRRLCYEYNLDFEDFVDRGQA